jgi:hypothetical protein
MSRKISIRKKKNQNTHENIDIKIDKKSLKKSHNGKQNNKNHNLRNIVKNNNYTKNYSQLYDRTNKYKKSLRKNDFSHLALRKTKTKKDYPKKIYKTSHRKLNNHHNNHRNSIHKIKFINKGGASNMGSMAMGKVKKAFSFKFIEVSGSKNIFKRFKLVHANNPENFINKYPDEWSKIQSSKAKIAKILERGIYRIEKFLAILALLKKYLRKCGMNREVLLMALESKIEHLMENDINYSDVDPSIFSAKFHSRFEQLNVAKRFGKEIANIVINQQNTKSGGGLFGKSSSDDEMLKYINYIYNQSNPKINALGSSSATTLVKQPNQPPLLKTFTEMMKIGIGAKK